MCTIKYCYSVPKHDEKLQNNQREGALTGDFSAIFHKMLVLMGYLTKSVQFSRICGVFLQCLMKFVIFLDNDI